MDISLVRVHDRPHTSYWRYSSSFKVLFWGLRQEVLLRHVGQHIQPLQMQFKGFGRKRQLHYDWEDGSLHYSDEENNNRTLPLRLGTGNSATMPLAIATDLSASDAPENWKKSTAVPNSAATRLKLLSWRFGGREKLTTPAGTFDCVVVQAWTPPTGDDSATAPPTLARTLWLAPAENWIMVRSVEHLKDRELELAKLQFTDAEG